MTYTLAQISRIVQGNLKGNPDAIITDIAEIQNACKGELSFLSNPKYTKFLETTGAEAILVPKDFKGKFKNLILVENPNYAFSLLIAKFRPRIPLPKPHIDPSASIAKTATIGNDVYIGPNVIIDDHVVIGNKTTLFGNIYIGKESTIGSSTVIYSNVSIYHRCQIGNDVIIHSGAVIGSDGYGFVRTEDGISKIPQEGGVVISNDVEIGANCAIDRGTLGNTVIGKGTKLDNFIHVAHNVKIGQYCFIVAQSGISGSTQIADGVTIAGQVGIAGHLKVGKGAIIAAQSGITKDVPPGAIMFGYPAQERSKARREIGNIRSIPDIKERLKIIERELEQLKQGK
jgi:UDP-3-O-[3-hydroxymyristoyl] glucosamine N-acyltransferase